MCAHISPGCEAPLQKKKNALLKWKRGRYWGNMFVSLQKRLFNTEASNKTLGCRLCQRETARLHSAAFLFIFPSLRRKKFSIFSVKPKDGIFLFSAQWGVYFQAHYYVSCCVFCDKIPVAQKHRNSCWVIYLFIYFKQLKVNPEHISVSDLLHMYYVIWIASGTWFQT